MYKGIKSLNGNSTLQGGTAANLSVACDSDDEVNLPSPEKQLHPLWISGFVDGDGSFFVKVTPSL